MGAPLEIIGRCHKEILRRRTDLYDLDYLKKPLKQYCEALDVVCLAGEPGYLVCIRVANRGGPDPAGYYMPLFRVDRDISPSELLRQVERRDLWKRRPDFSETEDTKTGSIADRFLPGFGEYFADLVRWSDNWTIEQRLKEYKRDLERGKGPT